MSDDPSHPPLLVPDEAPPSPEPWGAWATIGFAVIIGIAYVLTQSMAVGIYIAITGAPIDLKKFDVEKITGDGKALVVATLLSAPVMVAGCMLFAWLRKGISLEEYFALRRPTAKQLLSWAGVLIGFLILSGIATSFIGDEATEKFMRSTLDSVGPLMPFLWVALTVAAPLGEEFFFRGFLFAGLARSRLGPYGAILITSLAFAAIHLQYELQGLIVVFGVGIIFAMARWKTNSLWVSILLHALMNLIATLEFQLFDKT